MNWAKWDAEHGSGGGGVSSADKIAAQIRGALGPGKMDAPKVTSTKGKSGSTISRASEARSASAHVLKKDMKRPAPVKGQKDAADAFRTKIRMAAYNEKKKAAAAADPVNKHTPHTEEEINPHKTPDAAAKAKYHESSAHAHKATMAAEEKNDPAAHKAAAEAHDRAAKLASLSTDHNYHAKLAQQYHASAAKLQQDKDTAHGKYADAMLKAAAASQKARTDKTAASHTAAAYAHSDASKLATTVKDREFHNTGVTHHTSMASHYNTATEKKVAAKKVAAPPPPAPVAAKKVAAAAAGSKYSDAIAKAEAASQKAHADNSPLSHIQAANAYIQAANLAPTTKEHDALYAKADPHTATAKELAPTPHVAARKAKEALNAAGPAAKKAAAKKAADLVASRGSRTKAAEEATKTAIANPSYVNHQKAYEAHTAASLATQHGVEGDQGYHQMMSGYHRFAADHPDKVVPAGINQEHKDDQAAKFPKTADHQLFSSFIDPQSRQQSQTNYDSATKAHETTLLPPYKSAVAHYTGSGYIDMNGHLRKNAGSTSGAPAGVALRIKNMDAAFSKQPDLASDLVTYRGVKNASNLFGGVGEKVGGEFVDHGYTSTSSHAHAASGFGGVAGGGGALVRVLHSAGSKLLVPSKVGNFGDREREMITPRGTRFHIAADRLVTMRNGQQHRVIDLVRK